MIKRLKIQTLYPKILFLKLNNCGKTKKTATNRVDVSSSRERPASALKQEQEKQEA